MDKIQRVVVEEFVNALRTSDVLEVPEGSRIRVHATVSRFSVLYERIRNAVDYKDDHLLRRSAMKRIIGRQFILEKDSVVIASLLIREMIAAGYLPNNALPEQLIDEAAIRIQKYQVVAQARVGSEAHLQWLRSILCVELEELFVDSNHEKQLVTFLYERLADRIHIAHSSFDVQDVRLQVYIACYRTLLKADNDILGYKLLRAYMPEWVRPQEWISTPTMIAERLIGVERHVRVSLSHPFALKFHRAVKPWAVALNILKDCFTEKSDVVKSLDEKPDVLRALIERICDRRYDQIKGRVRRGAMRATLYLFLTKMIIAFLIEVPLEQFWYKAVAMTALIINLLLPPLMMVIVSLFIRIPGKNNTQRIQANVQTLLSEDGVPSREIRATMVRKGSSKFFFSLIYFLMFVITFGLIGFLLSLLQFTWFSAAIFYFFLCVVSFFAFRLRQSALEYVVIEKRERFSTVFFDFLLLPILRAGQWLSRSIAHLNVFMFFLDFIIEAPLKIFLGVLEEWFAFMKEKKEELE